MLHDTSGAPATSPLLDPVMRISTLCEPAVGGAALTVKYLKSPGCSDAPAVSRNVGSQENRKETDESVMLSWPLFFTLAVNPTASPTRRPSRGASPISVSPHQ